MGKAAPDPAASLEQQGDRNAQLKQLKSLLMQLKESRDNSQQQLENLRSEVSILRKKQENEAELEPVSEEDHKKKEQSLELELNDAKKQILRLQQENSQLRYSNNNRDAGTVALSLEGDDDGKTQTKQSDEVKEEMRRMKKKINKAVRQIEKFKKIRIFLEHQLEVSRFRENEAVVFLRRFRSFYYMIWRNNVVRGSGGYVANRIALVQSGNNAPAGAADEKELANIDKLMVDSGLLEKEETGKPTKDDQQTPYKGPTKIAFGKSSVAAEIAKRNAMIRENAPGRSSQAPAPVNKISVGEGNGIEVPEAPSLGVQLSAIMRPEDAKLVDARQKLEETPAGRCIVLREKGLELEVTKLSDRAMDLEKELEEERRKNNAPGSDAKLAEEANVLRKMLQSKENDLRIIVGKLRESCIVNWKMEESVKRLEEHILYLEDRLKNYEIRGLPYDPKKRRAWPTSDFLSTSQLTGEPKKSARTGGPDSVKDGNPVVSSDQEAFENMLARQEEEILARQEEEFGGVRGEETVTDDSMGDRFGSRREYHSVMDDMSSKMHSSRRFPTRVVAREMRYQGPSPAELWKQKKEAERIQRGEGTSTGERAGEGAVKSDDSNPLVMGNGSKETANRPPWMPGGRGMRNKKLEDNPEDAGLPEFIRNFKRIGMKAEEVVVVAQGASDGTKNARLGMETVRQWSSGNNKQGENDDEKSPVPSPAPSPPPSPIPAPAPEPERETEPEPAAAPEPEAAPATSPPPAPAPEPAAESKSSFLDSASDSSDSSAAKRKKAAASKPPPPPAPAPAPTAGSKSSFLDSDSDDSSDASAAKREKAAPSKSPPPKKKSSFLDSDSSSDDSS